MSKQTIKVGHIGQSELNNNFVEFKVGENYYSVNRDSINTIKTEYSYIDEEATIFSVEVHTDVEDYVFEIFTHNVEELKSFLLVAGTELSYDYYCKDTQRMIRNLLRTNDEMKKLNEEAMEELREGQKIVDELMNHSKELSKIIKE